MLELKKEKHLKPSETVRDIIIGMSDGLTVPFALAAGLSSAVSSSSLIVIAGLAEIVAGSIAMGLGGYMAAQSDADYYFAERARTERQIAEFSEHEEEKVAKAFRSYGLKKDAVASVMDAFRNDTGIWLEFVMRHDLNLEEPNPKRSLYSGLTIAASYIVGGAVPLSPYIFIHAPHQALLVSVVVTLIALVIFGILKSRFVGTDPLKGALRTAVIGSIAAGAAYFIAHLLA